VHSVHPGDLILAATDNYPPVARLCASSEVQRPDAVALIKAGAGIGSGYYDRFARFLAESGVPTLVYDYCGIGKSRPRSLRGFAGSVEDWGSKDCTAALEWIGKRFPGARRVIGHSIGGL
jgi:predicted alpha/beta hydrolase